MTLPGLTSVHCAHAKVDCLREVEVPTVARDLNPPNVPQIRPIEDFWGIIKRALYQRSWVALSDQIFKIFKSRIRRCLQ